jgi:polysaccharide export outer membrane protein
VAAAAQDYLIGPLDTIGVSVFNEPNLSVQEAPVSLSGKVSLPLLGELPASGKSSAQLARDITSLLNARYLRNAQVSVAVIRAANFTVTVDGEVKKPGIYQIPGAHLSLLQAVALGEGVTELAKLNEVLIIREVNGQRYAARFDLNAIRAAQMKDPQIQQSDIIVVGYSRAAALLRTFIAALPGAAGIFVALNK